MKKKELEILLQKVPLPNNPIPNLEQYMTPASIAADIIFTAHQFGDIENKIIIDLGCGTGIFSVGAALAGAKKVTGIDADKDVVTIAKEYAKKNNLGIKFMVNDVKNVQTKCNTVIMNPPFGAQKGNQKADRKFIEKGFDISKILYSIHLKKTIPFLEKMISSLGGSITYRKDYVFPIRWTFEFHDKEVVYYDVTLLRIETNI
ncbi:MAG: methyltransferase [Thermoplasmatales archaeon]|nr:methyltransferase [Thermoplasmatales archaeon]MCK5260751.1 methyltransferase [Thermoplasmatales archaeon]